METQYYLESEATVFADVQSSPQGLSSGEAQGRLERDLSLIHI